MNKEKALSVIDTVYLVAATSLVVLFAQLQA